MKSNLVASEAQAPSARRRARVHVRTLRRDDLPRVAELHAAYLGGKERRREDVESFLGEVFFGHPWRDDSLPSLACEDATGRLVGCLGVMPRPLLLDGEPVRAVVSHNFMVDADHRTGLAALQLLDALRRLEPEAAFLEPNEAGRRLAKGLGATVVEARSKRWIRPLRPVALAASMLSPKVPEKAAGPLERLASLGDLAVERLLPRARWRVPTPRGRSAPLDAALLADLFERHASRAVLRPVYTVESLEWVLRVLRGTRRNQCLRARAVLDGDETAGWFIYYSRPGGLGRVLQLGASPESRGQVLAHLLADAARDGNAGVSGATDPAWQEQLAASRCIVRERGTWLMVESRRPDLLRALESEDAFFGRLEGEGWLRFAF